MTTVDLPNILRYAVHAQGIGGHASDAHEATMRAAGVYASAPTCQLALAIRTRDYKPSMLDHAVLTSRTLLRVPAMRGSIYLMPVEWVPHALVLTIVKPLYQYIEKLGISADAYPRLAQRIEETLADGPLPSTGIRAALGSNAPEGSTMGTILRLMTQEGRLVRAGVRGGARSQNYEYAVMSKWIKLPRKMPSQAEALATLAPAWFLANGPGTLADLAWWAGVPQRDAKPALMSIGARVVQVPGIKGDCYATPELLDRLATPPPSSPDLHLLPIWDSYVMAHADRSRYLDDKHRPYVLDRSGNATNIILKDGRIVGIWDFDGDTLLYFPFSKLTKTSVLAAGRRLAPLHDFTAVREVKDPIPVSEAIQTAFVSPLTNTKGRYDGKGTR